MNTVYTPSQHFIGPVKATTAVIALQQLSKKGVNMAALFHSEQTSVLAGLIPAEDLLRELGITRNTLSKYEADPMLMFPLSMKIGRRKYYSRRGIDRWLRLNLGDSINDAA